MRSRRENLTGLVPRYALWAKAAAGLTAWDLYGWQCHEGAGDDLDEATGRAPAADYSGTAITWDDPVLYGVTPSGDGGWVVDASLEPVFDLSVPSTIVVAGWLTITTTAAAFSGQECWFCAGVDNATATNSPKDGHIRCEIAKSASIIKTRILYRNASATQGAAPANQELLGAVNIESDGSTPLRAHHALVLSSDGTTVTYATYIDGVEDLSGAFTVNGSAPMKLVAQAASRVCIGAKILNGAGGITGNAHLGSGSSGADLESLVLAHKAADDAAGGAAIVTELFRHRTEAPLAAL